MIPIDPIEVLIVDDHALVRTVLRLVLDCEPDIRVVGEAHDGVQALEMALSLRPHVVLADVNMPPPDGIRLASLLKTQLPETRTLIVTAHEDINIAREALAAGAVGCLTKRGMASDLPRAIRMAVAGLCYLDEVLLEDLNQSSSDANAFPLQP